MSAREKNIVAFTVALALLCLSYILGVEPVMKDWRKSEAKIDALNMKLVRMNSVIRSEKSLERRRKNLLSKTNIPGGAQNAGGYMLEQLAAITDRPGVSVNGVSPLPDEEYDFYNTIHTRLDIECGLGDFVGLVMDLQNNAVAISVEKAEIGPKDKDSNLLKGYIEVSMTALKGGGKANDKTQ